VQVENAKAQAANYPFCTIEPNVGVVAVPDPRLDVLSQLSHSQRVVPTSVEFVDIAGLVKGASQGEVFFFSLAFPFCKICQRKWTFVLFPLFCISVSFFSQLISMGTSSSSSS
jgi:hypothetical protein